MYEGVYMCVELINYCVSHHTLACVCVTVLCVGVTDLVFGWLVGQRGLGLVRWVVVGGGGTKCV